MITRLLGMTGRLAAVLVVLAVSGLLGPTASADDEIAPKADISLKSLKRPPMTVVGYSPGQEIWFPGYGDYAVTDGNYLHLEFDYSDLARPSDSTLTAYLNDVPVGSIGLGREKIGRKTWDVPLPKDRLRRDYNQVTLTYFMRTRDDEVRCQDNPALWSTIYEETYLHLEYAKPLVFLGLPEPDLRRLPEPFLRPGKDETNLGFVVPDDPSTTDLTVAATIAAKFGQLAGGRALETRLRVASQVDEEFKKKYDLIVIGRLGTNKLIDELAPGLILKPGLSDNREVLLDPSRVPIEPDSGTVQIVSSPWQKTLHALVVSGLTDEALMRGARVLSSRVGLLTLQGPYAILTEARPELGTIQSRSRSEAYYNVTLKEIGVGDISTKMLRGQVSSFSFDAPPPNMKEPAYLNLVMSYSTLLDPVLSSVTIRLNGAPIRTLALPPDNSQRGEQRVMLPPTSLKAGTNAVNIDFNLYVRRGDWPCADWAMERGWVIVHEDSEFVLPTGSDVPVPDLANLPYPFISRGTPGGSYLVMPDEGPELERSLEIALSLGRQSIGENTDLRAGFSRRVTDEVKRRYDLIAFGAPENNSIIREISPWLPLSLEGGTHRVVQRPELVLLGIKDSAKIGVVELVRSPWGAGKSVLLLSGTETESIRRTWVILEARPQSSNTAVITKDDKGFDKIDILKLVSAIVAPEPEILIQRRYYLMAAGAVAILIVGMLLVLTFRSVKQGRQATRTPSPEAGKGGSPGEH